MPDIESSISDPADDTRWDRFFLRIARECASMSKDPSTRVGSVIVRPNKTIVSTGWNGFARGMDDDPRLYENREFKTKTVVHAEINAILMAREALDDYTLYTVGLPPCPQCAVAIIQSGIARVVTAKVAIPDRWVEDIRLSLTQLLKAGIDVHFLDEQANRRYKAIRQPKHAANGIALCHAGGSTEFGELIYGDRQGDGGWGVHDESPRE